MAGYHFVKHHAETPDISALINMLSARLLRRHVTNGPQYSPKVGLHQQQRFVSRHGCWQFLLGELCNPKVEHLYVSVRPEHDVFRLDVTVHNPGLMSGGERAGHLNRDVHSFTNLDSPARETLTQRLALNQFTSDVMNRVILADLVNGQNIRMIETNNSARFLLKPLQAVGVSREPPRRHMASPALNR